MKNFFVLQIFNIFSKNWSDHSSNESIELIVAKKDELHNVGFREKMLRIVKRNEEVVWEGKD